MDVDLSRYLAGQMNYWLVGQNGVRRILESLELNVKGPFMNLEVDSILFNPPPLYDVCTVVSGRLNVVKDLKRTNQIVGLGRNRHLIGL